jgi:hypothetical protein
MSESVDPTIIIRTTYDPRFVTGAEAARGDDRVAAQVEENDA